MNEHRVWALGLIWGSECRRRRTFLLPENREKTEQDKNGGGGQYENFDAHYFLFSVVGNSV